MDTARIAELLEPFLPAPDSLLLEQLQTYLELLLRWNARTNLTAVRRPEEMVTRHFGESLFAARVLLGEDRSASGRLADVGSGAGFPGVPMKLFAPGLRLTLIESQNKKATFLRELVRALELRDAEVFYGRAERWGQSADYVTLRAVEKIGQALSVAADLVAPGGRMGVLIAAEQTELARMTISQMTWREEVGLPMSEVRVVLIGEKPG